MSNNAQIGKRIRAARRQRGFTPTQLADAAETSKQRIWQIETGITGLSIDMLDRIAKALDVPLCELISDKRKTA